MILFRLIFIFDKIADACDMRERLANTWDYYCSVFVLACPAVVHEAMKRSNMSANNDRLKRKVDSARAY